MTLLPSSQELKRQYPLTSSQLSFIEQSRGTIRHILNGEDPRLLLIVGPCSIHDTISAKDFAIQLKSLAAEVASQFLLVMRVYCEKPRTSAGWKGLLYDPFLNGSNQIKTGIQWTRQLLLELAKEQVPAATEFLDPATTFYYDDLISWGSIGARTSSSQIHRQLASGLQMPIGIKNGIAGNLSAAIHGAFSASQSHVYVGLDAKGRPAIIETWGNKDAHIVLRGGESGPNYDSFSIAEALDRLQQLELPQRLIVDCSHQNSGKQAEKQPEVFQSVLQQVATNSAIRGLMLESHLYAGNQTLSNGSHKLKYGVSITDPCLDWPSTKQLILNGAHWFADHLLNYSSLAMAN